MVQSHHGTATPRAITLSAATPTASVCTAATRDTRCVSSHARWRAEMRQVATCGSSMARTAAFSRATYPTHSLLRYRARCSWWMMYRRASPRCSMSGMARWARSSSCSADARPSTYCRPPGSRAGALAQSPPEPMGLWIFHAFRGLGQPFGQRERPERHGSASGIHLRGSGAHSIRG